MAAVEGLLNRALASASWLPPASRGPVDIGAVASGERVVICISEGAQLEGFISVYEPESFIHHLYVEPGREGLGTGTRLLSFLEPVLPFPWRLKCVLANTDALEFYRKLGWREESRGVSEDGPYAVLVRHASDSGT